MKNLLALLLLAVALPLSACGGSSSESSTAASSSNGGERVESSEEPVKMTIAAFAGPGQTAALAETATKMGIAEKYGIDLRVEYMGTLGAYYTGLANGTVDAAPAGALPIAAQRVEDVPVQILNTLTTFEMTSVLTGNPEVKTLADLKGKTLAATTAASEYQVLAITAKEQGIDLGKDIKITNAEAGGMLALMTSGRVDAVHTWEPTVTQMENEDGSRRIIWNGARAWEELTGRTGRNMVFVIREDFANAHADALPRIVDMWKEVVETIQAKPDEVDELLVKSARITPGLFADAQKSGRLGWEVLPAWDEEASKDLNTMFERSIEAGFLKKPPSNLLYVPSDG